MVIPLGGPFDFFKRMINANEQCLVTVYRKKMMKIMGTKKACLFIFFNLKIYKFILKLFWK